MLLNLSFILLAMLALAALTKGLITATAMMRSDRELDELRAYLDWKPDQAG